MITIEPIDLSKYKDTDIATIQLQNGKKSEMTIAKLKDLIKTKLIFTTNNTLFLKPSIKKGLLNSWSEYYFNRRKAIKKKMFEAHKAGDSALEQRLNNMQLSIKTFLNTVYGITGTKYSPIGNPDIAQTITRQGKLANTSANKFIGEQFKEMFNVENYKLTTGGDTDSVFYNSLVDISL